MSDYAELKRLAEAATQGEWVHESNRPGGVVRGGPIQHWLNGSGLSQIALACGADWMTPGEQSANAAFIAAANPATVLALIAENERLAATCEGLDRQNDAISDEIDEVAADRDALAIQRDQLRTDLERQTELRRQEWNRAEGLEKDAVRYRWLCDQFGITKLPCAIERVLAGDVYVADGKAGIDSAIDAAMTKEGAQ